MPPMSVDDCTGVLATGLCRSHGNVYHHYQAGLLMLLYAGGGNLAETIFSSSSQLDKRCLSVSLSDQI